MGLSAIRKLYDEYVDTFREPGGTLPAMMQLKYTHTMMVVRNAELIAEGEGFSSAEREAALIAALLHDTGRYEQLRRYNTFRDSESVDHAVFSHQIVKDSGWVDEPAILEAILLHNRRELPADLLTPSPERRLAALLAHIVRDADKLDIFRVLEDQVAHSDWRHDSRAFWNLQVGVPPNPAVTAAIRERRPVDYQHIQSLADFVLIQVGWMLSGLHFGTSRRLCAERGHLAYRRDFLREIGGGAEAEALCALVEAEL